MSDEYREPEAREAELYRLAQARRLMACYEEANGHPAPTTEALQEWVAANPDRIPKDEHGNALPLYDSER
jgi:hypothetical protein